MTVCCGDDGLAKAKAAVRRWPGRRLTQRRRQTGSRSRFRGRR